MKEKMKLTHVLIAGVLVLGMIAVILGFCFATRAEEPTTEEPSASWYMTVADWATRNIDTIMSAVATAFATVLTGVLAGIFRKTKKSNNLTVGTLKGYDDAISKIVVAINQTADELGDLRRENEELCALCDTLRAAQREQRAAMHVQYKAVRAILDTIGIMVDKSTLPTATKERIDEIRAQAARTDQGTVIDNETSD